MDLDHRMSSIRSNYQSMRDCLSNFERTKNYIICQCHRCELPDDNKLYQWLRFDVVQSMESCIPMMNHYIDLHDMQKFSQFMFQKALPILVKVQDAFKKMPIGMYQTPEWFLLKNISDKVSFLYVKIKEVNE